jgi:hypothetical protein
MRRRAWLLDAFSHNLGRQLSSGLTAQTGRVSSVLTRTTAGFAWKTVSAARKDDAIDRHICRLD